MTRMREITFGALTRTIREWSKITGIPVSIIRDRLKGHWPVEEALTIPPLRGPYSRSGSPRFRREPKSADKLANGNYPANGNTLPPKSRKARITITFNGETLTLDEWAERIGITKTGLRDRLRNPKAWTMEQALTTAPNSRGFHGPRSRPKTPAHERPYKPVVRCIDGRPTIFYVPNEVANA